MPEKTARSGATYAAHYADVHVLVRRDGRLLMGRRRHPTVFPRMFQIPAGLLEEHESARHGAARELREETGIRVSPGSLRFVHVMHHVSTHAGDERIAFFFEIDHPHEEVDNPEPHRCDGAQRYGTGVADQRLTDLIPETAGKSAWSNVTVDHALDMTTGNYTSAGFEVDEAGGTMTDFFLAEPYATKIDKALSFRRKTTPGSKWVYHTSDTFLAARGMNNYLQNRAGSGADLFDMLRDEVLTPIGISPEARVSSRTDNSADGVPFGGYGMFWTKDDVAKFAKFLNNDAGAVAGTQVLHPGLLADSMQRNPSQRGATTSGSTPMHYQNGFWGQEFTAADDPACTQPFHVPFMSGYGGITIAMMPNGSTYYYISDNNEYSWSAAVAESNKLAPMV